MIKAILFDLDDTLADRKISMRKYGEKFIKKYCGTLEKKEIVKRVDYFIKLDGKGYKDKFVMYEKLINEWKLDKSLTAKSLYTEWTTDFHESYILFNSSLKILTDLKPKYTLGLLTNGSRLCQRSKIKAVDIEKYFNEIIVSREEGIAKPDKEVYFRLCNRLGVEPNECIFVGDNYNTDILGAINANITAVWINTDFKGDLQEEEYGYQISTIDNLHLVLKRIHSFNK